MSENGSRKAADANATGWQILLAFLMWLAAHHFVTDVPVESLYAVLGFLVGKQGVHAWGNAAEHAAKAKVAVAEVTKAAQ